MKKAASILYKISFILAIVGLVILLLLGIGFIACSQNNDFIQQIVDKQIIKINGNPATFEQAQVFVLAYGIVFLVYAALQVVVAVLTKIAEKQIESDKKGMHITMIVLGAIGGGILPLLGGIFALVSQVQKSNQ